MSLFYFFTSIGATLFNFVLGSFVLITTGKNKTNRRYALLCFSLGAWTFWDVLSVIIPANHPTFALLVCRSLYMIAILLPVCYLNFAFSIAEIKDRLFSVFLVNVLTAALFISNFTSLFIAGMRFETNFGNSRYILVEGSYYSSFLYLYALTAIYGVIEVIIAYRRTGGFKKTQLGYIILATFVGYSAALFYFPSIFGIPVIPMDNVVLMAYTAIIAYAILRHRLMDIEFVIKRTIVYSSSVILAVVVYVGIVASLGTVLNGLIHPLLVFAIASFFAIITWGRGEKYFTKVTNKYFFKKPYDLMEMRERYAVGLSKLIPLHRLADRLVSGLYKPMQLESACSLVFNPEKGYFEVLSAHCRTTIKQYDYIVGLRCQTYELGRLLVERLTKGQTILLDDLARLNGIEGSVEAIEKMNAINAKIVVPTTFKTDGEVKLLGILALGDKLSGDSFSYEDQRFFADLSGLVAIALNNSFIQNEFSKVQAELAVKSTMAEVGEQTGKVIHDIRNYFSPISIFLDTFDGAIKNEQVVLPKYLVDHGYVSNSIKRIMDLLDWLKSYMTGNPTIFEDIDLNAFLFEMKPFSEILRPHKDIEIIVEAGQLPPVRGVKQYLARMFLNLFVNAFDAIGANSGRVIIRTSFDGNFVNIVFSDNGGGMSPETLKRLFHESFTTKETGSGKGSMIIKEAVDVHSGKLEIVSEIGRGTQFSIMLPVK